MGRRNAVIADDGVLRIRHATTGDAQLLTRWWNNGSIMAHAGFPDGIGTTEDDVARLIANDDDQHRRLILEHGGSPIGEMNYRTKGDGIAEIGIKICDTSRQERGFGTRYLTMLLTYLYEQAGYRKVILDTKQANKRAQHVYEQKLGFHRTTVTEETIAYELARDDFRRRAAAREDQ